MPVVAPLVAQKPCAQGLAAARPGRADVVVGAHDRLRGAHLVLLALPRRVVQVRHAAAGMLDHDLERPRVDLADRLLARPREQVRTAVRVLVVQAEVLHLRIHPAREGALDLGRRQRSREQRVFREVLEVPAAEGAAVAVHGRRAPAAHPREQHLLPNCLGHPARQVDVPGLSQQVLAGKAAMALIAHVDRDSRRAVALEGPRLTHRRHGVRSVGVVVQYDAHHVGVQLIEQQLPQRVVHGPPAQVDERDAVLLAGLRHLVGGVHVLGGVVLRKREADRRRRLVLRRLGEGSREVAARKLRAVGLHVRRHVLEAVLDRVSRGRVGVVGRAVEAHVHRRQLRVGVAAQADPIVARVEHPRPA